MKKLWGIVLICAALALPVTTHADASKYDGMLRLLASQPAQGKVLLSKAVSMDGERMIVDCFVKSSDVLATERAILEAGGTVDTILKTIMTAKIPVDALGAISDRPEVIALEASRPVASKMNMARSFTSVTGVQSGTGLSQAYKGSGVMVGAVDDGLNWGNDDFSGGSGTRVAWLQREVAGSTQTCDKIDIDEGFCNIIDGGGTYHGTHVTGIMGGDDSTYLGVAPEAWIGFIFNAATDADSGGTFSTAVVNGVDDLFYAADDFDVPAVVNLSLGTSLGAHDNTSLMEEGLNELVDGQRGRLITNAAGNENVNPNPFDAAAPGSSAFIGGIHGEINTTAGTDEGWRIGIWNGVGAVGVPTGGPVVDVWLDVGNDTNCVIDVKAYKLSDFGNDIIPPSGPNANTGQAALSVGNVPFSTDSTGTATDAASDVVVTVNTFQSEPQNGKPHALVTIKPGSGGTAADLQAFAYDVIIRATSGTCTGDMWLYPDQTGILDFLKSIDTLAVDAGANGAGYNFVDGDSFKTTTIPGTASGVITVGSYMGRGTWTDIDGVTRNQDVYDNTAGGVDGGGTGGTVDRVSLFSSLGPTADGRHKPEVVAPGEPIISTLANGISPVRARLGDSNHWKLEGTSMASPHVAGIIALMLQKNNCLTLTDVRNALVTTANVSALTSYTADAQDTYGGGIVDALAAMGAISADTSCYSGGGGGGGGGGSSSCSLYGVGAGSAGAASALALMLAPLAAIVWRRRRK